MLMLRRMAVVVAAVCCAQLMAANDKEDLRREIDELRRNLNNNGSAEATIQGVDAMMDQRSYEGEHKVTTKTGKLEIGGLLQLWDVHYQQARRDVFGNDGGDLLDNSGRRVRRAELKFTMDIHENISAVVMIDAARENTSYVTNPSNQGLFKSAPVNLANTGGPGGATANGQFTTGPNIANLIQTGGGDGNRILQDAYINFHGLLPHHDLTVGQFRPAAGEEGVRNNGNLDFVERAMVTQQNELRDLGVQLHGTWWEDCDTKIGRLQYWVGAFDAAGNHFDTAGDYQNRSDDNDAKDVIGKIMVRPIWSNCLYGRLELGIWGQTGEHGEQGDNSTDGSAPVNGLNRTKTWAHREGMWFMYKPMGCLRGLWTRGEYAEFRDRTAPFSVNAFGGGSGPFGEQASPNPFKREGYYGAAGYKLTDSIFAERLSKGGFFNKLLEPVEFAFRFESFENIIVEKDDQNSDKYRTQVFTAGVNYYVNAYKHRIQVNWSNVDERLNIGQHAGLRSVQNNMYVMSYQIQF